MKKKIVNFKNFASICEETAIAQLEEIKNRDIFQEAVIRIMPDVHAGTDCVIGFTSFQLFNSISEIEIDPYLVGNDIGCGVLTLDISPLLDERELTNIDFEKLDTIIREEVTGTFNDNSSILNMNKVFSNLYFDQYKALIADCFSTDSKKINKILSSFGTLGGGNHFIEIDKNKNNQYFLTIHSGSRNPGAVIFKCFTSKEFIIKYKEDKKDQIKAFIKQLRNEGREKEIEKELSKFKNNSNNKSILILKGYDAYRYLKTSHICIELAKLNRKLIAAKILSRYFNIDIFEILNKLDNYELFKIESIHNYIETIEKEDKIAVIYRKGAISAKELEAVVIPLNMKDGIIIGVGKGNNDWNYSAPHGAGRILSRTKAKKELSLDDYKKDMKDIYSTCVNNDTLDESSFAYKNPAAIIDNIEDTIIITEIMTPIYNFKANG